MAGQPFQVDVERARQEKEAQHSVEKGIVKLDALDEPDRLLLKAEGKGTSRHEGQGTQKRDGHDSDGGGKTNEPVILLSFRWNWNFPSYALAIDDGGKRNEQKTQKLQS